MGAGVRDAFPSPMCVYGCSFVYWWNGRGIGRGASPVCLSIYSAASQHQRDTFTIMAIPGISFSK